MKKPLRLILPTTLVVICLAIGLVDLLVDRPTGFTGTAMAEDQEDSATTSAASYSPYVDQDGNISLPQGYKQQWAHLGGWAVAKKPGEAIQELHDVYTQPETIGAFNKTGEFADGAVLIKEVRHTKADELSTGHAAWSTDMKIWFVMIKDRQGRFQENDNWGDGWGWALFEAKDPSKNVSAG